MIIVGFSNLETGVTAYKVLRDRDLRACECTGAKSELMLTWFVYGRLATKGDENSKTCKWSCGRKACIIIGQVNAANGIVKPQKSYSFECFMQAKPTRIDICDPVIYKISVSSISS